MNFYTNIVNSTKKEIEQQDYLTKMNSYIKIIDCSYNVNHIQIEN